MRPRYLRSDKEQVTTSRMREPEEGIIPPFSYIGPLERGITGSWEVTGYSVELIYAIVTAVTEGVGDAGFALVATNNVSARVLKTFILPSHSMRLVFRLDDYLDPAILHPGTRIQALNFSNSLHENVVIRFFGHKIGI